jgi:hypothetical protein
MDISSGPIADATIGGGFDPLQVCDESFDLCGIKDLVDGLVENGVKAGSEIAHRLSSFVSQGYRFRSSIFGIGLSYHEQGFLCPVEYPRDVTCAELELPTELDSAKSPLWSKVEPDQQVKCGRVESGVGDGLAVDGRSQRNLGREEHTRGAQQVMVEPRARGREVNHGLTLIVLTTII